MKIIELKGRQQLDTKQRILGNLRSQVHVCTERFPPRAARGGVCVCACYQQQFSVARAMWKTRSQFSMAFFTQSHKGALGSQSHLMVTSTLLLNVWVGGREEWRVLLPVFPTAWLNGTRFTYSSGGPVRRSLLLLLPSCSFYKKEIQVVQDCTSRK